MRCFANAQHERERLRLSMSAGGLRLSMNLPLILSEAKNPLKRSP